MQVSDRQYAIPLQNTAIRVAIATALFNEKITRALEFSARTELRTLGLVDDNILSLNVPGAWELPLAVKKLFQERKVDAVIACGCVIRGDTGHYDIVANQSAAGLMAVGIEFAKPVMNAVLTVENLAQAEVRAQNNASNKGAEAARSLVELLNNLIL